MEQSPSWEANRFSASQEIPLILWNPEGSLPQSQMPATCPYPEPAQSSNILQTIKKEGWLKWSHFAQELPSETRFWR